jgi:hypothetical protein
MKGEKMSHFALPDWAEIISEPAEHIGEKVHVERWNPGVVFVLERYINIVAFLSSPTNRHVDTKVRLYMRR